MNANATLDAATKRLIARILQCPDCAGALQEDLRCGGCGRSFAPADDGIISALPTGMVQPATDSKQLETIISAQGPGEHGQTVVLYEQAFHDQQAPDYDKLFADPLPMRHYYRRLVREQIFEYVRDVPFVVDLCCGTGKSSIPLVERGMTVVGMDVSREMLRIYRSKCRGPRSPILVQADASRPPLRRNSCAALSMIGGLHHIPDQAGSLESCCNALSEGGLLILHEPLKTGQRSKAARLLENLYAITDPVRVWSAIGRRMGLRRAGSNEQPVIAPDFTPYERPFRSSDELIEVMPDQMKAVTIRGQGALSFREFAPLLQRSVGLPLAAAVVRLDEWLSRRSSANWSGDALFAVFQKQNHAAR
jgi:ubiquinone/menaquinone biosynthesis C-methylase UbiE